MRARLLLIVAVGLLMAPAAPKDDAARKEYQKFTGTWRFVSIEADRAKAEEDVFKNARLIVKGNEFSMIQGAVTYRGTYTVDVSKKPKTIDLVFTDGPEKGKTSLGIYELEGDTCKLCIALTGKDRPKEFVSKPGSGHVLEVLRREKR
jgi:uncharacterized protein (TIGR03067 family)